MRSELTVVSFICTILVLIPLPWHWRARNIPVLSLIFWLTVVNFPRAISTIIWAGNVENSASVWCDIITWLFMGANWGYSTSTIAMCRHLAYVSSPYHKAENASERRRRMIFEIFMCVVMPLIGMNLYYVVQKHRYDILEDIGCIPAFDTTAVSILLINLPPVIFSFVISVYSAISLRWFIHRRTQFEVTLQSNSSGFTTIRYLRLVLFSITMMLASLAMSTFVLVDNITHNGVSPWISWDAVHADWHNMDRVAKDLIPQSFWNRWLTVWYLVPVTSVLFFAFFGCAGEVKTGYMGYFNFIKTKVFRIKPRSQPVLPVSTQDGMAAINSTASTAAVVELQDETVAEISDKPDSAPKV